MSRRHQIALRLAGFEDVRAILAAMKNVALTELRALGGLIDLQRRAMSSVERAAADFLRFHAPPGDTRQLGTVCIAIGSERGFCGEFNESLALGARRARERGERLLVVGRLLGQRLAAGDEDWILAGASISEELPAVLERVATWLERAQLEMPEAPLHVKALYHDPAEFEPITRIVAPLPLPETSSPARAYGPRLTLAPAGFFAALLEQALLLSLQEVFSVSLMAENRRRLEHMEGALRTLDDKTAAMRRRMNAYRQEDITEEIEIIMLSAEALAGEQAG